MLKKQRKIRTSARKISTLLKIRGSLKTTIENEAEPELITDIRNRDQGFVLFCFCSCLFVCSFLKVKGGGIFSLVTCPLHFFSLKCPVSPRVLYDCVIIIDFRPFICHRASSRTVVRASVLELGGWSLRFSSRDWNFSELTIVSFLLLPNRFFPWC